MGRRRSQGATGVWCGLELRLLTRTGRSGICRRRLTGAHQNTFNGGAKRFTAPVAGLYTFGATCLYKVNSSTSARMQARLLKNGTDVVPGSFGGITGAHVSEVTALWFNVAVVLAANDTVELQGNFTGNDGYFAADHTRFWGFKLS